MESITTLEGKEELVSSGVVRSGLVIEGIDRHPSWVYCTLKRFLDITLALSGLIALTPVFIVIALWIKLEDGGTILYFREMVGLNGRRFTLLKFRTMIPDADTYLDKHPGLKLEFEKNMKLQYDPRITRLGRFLRKTYLDELPQLFNVLMGQMSLVGPRAIHQRELPLYGEFAEKRHSVKPGMTGSWQISPNRYSRGYEDRIFLDMGYVDSRSFFLDLLILVKTIKVLITLTGV